MMDTSPTTGSVNTTTSEKHRLAKSSLSFNCKNATFRKMFPEYVEKYNQQQLSEQAAPERVSSEMSPDNSSRSVLEKKLESTGEEMRSRWVNGCEKKQKTISNVDDVITLLYLWGCNGVTSASAV